MKPTILVISNNHRSSLTYTASLSGYGCNLHDVQTIEAARAMIRSIVQPDVVILDVKFVQIDIADFIHFVRQEMGLSQTRIMVIGGSADEQFNAFAAAADHFFVRPVDVTTILSALN
jgi:CheY-like chemotaxis protein